METERFVEKSAILLFDAAKDVGLEDPNAVWDDAAYVVYTEFARALISRLLHTHPPPLEPPRAFRSNLSQQH